MESRYSKGEIVNAEIWSRSDCKTLSVPCTIVSIKESKEISERFIFKIKPLVQIENFYPSYTFKNYNDDSTKFFHDDICIRLNKLKNVENKIWK